MSSSIQFVPLVGSQNEGPVCSILIVDDYYILLDCGWDENFNTKDSHIQEIINNYRDKIDAILISQSDIYHCGALPYLVGKCGILENKKKAKIFATLPIVKMGQMHLYDAYQNIRQHQDFETFDLDDVDLCFDSIHQLKYSQRYPLSQQTTIITQIEETDENGEEGEGGVVGSSGSVAEMEGEKLVICPFLAGHTLGGTIWKLTKETDEIVYAIDFNIKTERHLNGSVLGELGGKPALLITDAYNVKPIPSSDLGGVDKAPAIKIMKSITDTLTGGGNVLVPIETAGRVFELMLLLEERWKRDPQMANFELILLTNVAYRTIEFASHQLEWMSDKIMKGFDEKRENPFKFQYFSVCHNVEELMDKLQKKEQMRMMMENQMNDEDEETATTGKHTPMVVLASSNTLDYGYARELFVKWCEDQRNLVMFIERSAPNSLSRKLINKLRAKKSERLDENMSLTLYRRVALKGEELEKYEKEQQLKQEAEKKRREEEERNKRVIHVRDEDDEDLDLKKSKQFREELTGGADDDSQTHARLYLPENMRYHSQYLMFPCIERGISKDEYGESVDPEDFKLRLLQADQSEQIMADNTIHEEEDYYEPPSKIESENVSVRILCKLAYLDFEGRSSPVDIKNILQKINPRKLILIHGSQESIIELSDYCETKKISEQIKTPMDLEVMDMTMDTNMFKVKLKQDLLSQIHYIKSGTNYDMAYIEGIYRVEEGSDIPCIHPNPKPKGHPTMLIGDLKLNQFFKLLKESGLSAEFQQGGVLVCNDEVMLQKDKKSGEIQVFGSLSPTYFQVRELLYKFYSEL
ncbi:predicted protein [Naegleria gruberi]|uniref:Cleavage and polyadenylation specificity factor subunit 2 n=2 Tax=Naegleria gruberi TaxID=5762 RepID=D2VRL1_NAEGR|nr:uncharacterized protein NAEGRDRAFT_71624 [Naegleria gruberi]EFC40481.1 predicted protein [Naegleria gruberi]|eukprot:XP_002673225.1 predicted protein [Naegleria gruberi strain NEG-M]